MSRNQKNIFNRKEDCLIAVAILARPTGDMGILRLKQMKQKIIKHLCILLILLMIFPIYTTSTKAITHNDTSIVLDSTKPMIAMGKSSSYIFKLQYIGSNNPTEEELSDITSYSATVVDMNANTIVSNSLSAFTITHIDSSIKYVFADASYGEETVSLKISYSNTNNNKKYIPKETSTNKTLLPESKSAEVILNNTEQTTTDGVTVYTTKNSFTNATTSFYNEKRPCSIVLVKYSPDGKNKLSGVTFKIQKKDGSVVTDIAGNVLSEETTGPDGIVRFEGLQPDTYIITETKTQEGLQLLANEIEVTLPLGFTQQEVTDKSIDTSKAYYYDGNYYLYDCKYEISNSVNMTLPHTGGWPIYLAAIIGTILILFVIIYNFVKKNNRIKKVSKIE